jgi:hypothetical protein
MEKNGYYLLLKTQSQRIFRLDLITFVPQKLKAVERLSTIRSFVAESQHIDFGVYTFFATNS